MIELSPLLNEIRIQTVTPEKVIKLHDQIYDNSRNIEKYKISLFKTISLEILEYIHSIDFRSSHHTYDQVRNSICQKYNIDPEEYIKWNNSRENLSEIKIQKGPGFIVPYTNKGNDVFGDGAVFKVNYPKIFEWLESQERSTNQEYITKIVKLWLDKQLGRKKMDPSKIDDYDVRLKQFLMSVCPKRFSNYQELDEIKIKIKIKPSREEVWDLWKKILKKCKHMAPDSLINIFYKYDYDFYKYDYDNDYDITGVNIPRVLEAAENNNKLEEQNLPKELNEIRIEPINPKYTWDLFVKIYNGGIKATALRILRNNGFDIQKRKVYEVKDWIRYELDHQKLAKFYHELKIELPRVIKS